MTEFAVIADSTSDLGFALRKQYDLDYIPMHIYLDGVEHMADLDYKEYTPYDIYNILREGKRITTAQVTPMAVTEKFTKYLEQGKDVLYIACSSGLSSSINVANRIAEELMEKYPGRKIRCIDSLISGMGQGILCITASVMRSQGKSVDEVADYIEEIKLCSRQICTVEKLTYLQKAGRVSAASAFFGGLLNVKPIIVSDTKGRNAACQKVKGRKASIERIVERTVNEYIANPYYSDIHVAHADCEAEAQIIKDKLVAGLNIAPEKIHIDFLGPIIGASAGPGTLAIYFIGEAETFCAD
ncbi:MAG: DegV family protein [Clostridia bacterium]|nr:DegV family protein [Clostridia bacterium]